MRKVYGVYSNPDEARKVMEGLVSKDVMNQSVELYLMMVRKII